MAIQLLPTFRRYRVNSSHWAALALIVSLLQGCATPTAPAEEAITHGGMCALSSNPISAVQGSGVTSALKGKQVLVQGVVVANLTASDGSNAGFFIESTLAARDDQADTSEGIFIVAPAPVAQKLKRLVAVAGRVEEQSHGSSLLTSIIAAEPVSDCGPAALPVAVTLAAAPASMEALEGMRVRVSVPMVIAGNDELARYGALRLAFGARPMIPTQLVEPGAAAKQMVAANAARMLALDDGTLAENPAVIGYLNGAPSLKQPLRAGDEVSGVGGVLDDRFGYRIQSSQPVVLVEKNPRPTTPPPVPGRLKVASFNVLNFFNGDGAGSGFPTARGAQTVAEFERQKAKILSALVALDADIFGLMEIENDGFGPESALAELTQALNQRLKRDSYDYVRVPTTKIGGDQITNAIIFRKQSVKPVGGGMAQVNGPFQTGSRPPLLAAFEEIATGEKFTLVVNHFKSKGGCPQATRPGDQDAADGQACYNLARVEAALALAQGLGINPTGLGDPDFLLIGDFNSYLREDPMNALNDAGFLNLERFISTPDYSFVYQGEAGSLDHALVSESMSGQVKGHAVWHINADEPSLFEYGDIGKAQRRGTDWYAPDPYRSSDHDPVVIGLDLSSQAILM